MANQEPAPHALLSGTRVAELLCMSRSNWYDNFADKVPCVKPHEKAERRWLWGTVKDWMQGNERPRS